MRRKRFLAAAALAVFVAASAMAEDGVVAVRRVKIEIDGVQVSWDAAGGVPARAPGMGQDPRPIAGMLAWQGVEPGAEHGEDALAVRVEAVRAALEDSRLFYDVRAFVIPPQSDPRLRTVMVAVTTGFSLRFAGGGAWGMFGDDNADGSWLNYRLFAGYNLAGASVGRGLSWVSPAWWSAGLFYGNSGLEFDAPGGFRHDGRLVLRGGLGLGALRAELGLAGGGHVYADGTVNGDLLATPRLSLKVVTPGYLPGGSAAGLAASAWLGGDLGLLLPETAVADRWELAATAKGGVAGLTLAAQASAGLVPRVQPERFLFDLGGDADRGVRAAWGRAERVVGAYAVGNAELRWRPFAVPLGFVSAFSLEPFLFGDLALTAGPGLTGAPGTIGACGLGMRALFGMPVNTDLTVGVGCAPDPGRDAAAWRWKFVMAMSAGF